MIQGSDEWKKDRLCHVTASRVYDILPKIKGSGYKAARKNYAAEKVIEILTNAEVEDRFYSKPMERGNSEEEYARMEYESANLVNVVEVGFIKHPKIKLFGASPDGLVDLDGCLEIKCPNTAQHIEMLENKKVDYTYIIQIQSQLCCLERQWCDFISYDNRMPEGMKIFKKRVVRNESIIQAIEKEVVLFNKEVEKTVKDLQKSYKIA
jgi:hypothetical protein